MNPYVPACFAAALASAAITLGSVPTRSASEVAATAAWPVCFTPMARRSIDGWLLRAMSQDGSPATLSSEPEHPPAEPQSL